MNLTRYPTGILFAISGLLAQAACDSPAGDDPALPAVDAAVVSVDGAPPKWAPPACSSVTGTGAVTFTHDDGVTLAPTSEPLTGVRYTMGLVALATPNVLLAAHSGHILRSDDAGCTWRDLGSVSGDVVLVAAGDRAYGYGDNQPLRVRIVGDQITRLPDHTTGVIGMAANTADALHARMVDSNAQVWESHDGGDTWTAIGTPADTGQHIVYRGAFAPGDLDHIVIGASFTGAHVSQDGGAHWKPATGLSTTFANAMNLAVAPADASVVWATGIDLADSSRHVWRSDDGGATFTSVVTDAEMTIANGMDLFPHPTDIDVLYSTFGTYFQNYGTDLYRYDVATDKVSVSHNAFHQVHAIAFLPSDPTWMWLGASSTAVTVGQ